MEEENFTFTCWPSLFLASPSTLLLWHCFTHIRINLFVFWHKLKTARSWNHPSLQCQIETEETASLVEWGLWDSQALQGEIVIVGLSWPYSISQSNKNQCIYTYLLICFYAFDQFCSFREVQLIHALLLIFSFPTYFFNIMK